MHDMRFVNRFNTKTDLFGYVDNLRGWQKMSTIQQMRKTLAIDPVHGDKHSPVGLADIVNPDDMLVVYSGR